MHGLKPNRMAERPPRSGWNPMGGNRSEQKAPQRQKLLFSGQAATRMPIRMPIPRTTTPFEIPGMDWPNTSQGATPIVPLMSLPFSSEPQPPLPVIPGGIPLGVAALRMKSFFNAVRGSSILDKKTTSAHTTIGQTVNTWTSTLQVSTPTVRALSYGIVSSQTNSKGEEIVDLTQSEPEKGHEETSQKKTKRKEKKSKNETEKKKVVTKATIEPWTDGQNEENREEPSSGATEEGEKGVVTALTKEQQPLTVTSSSNPVNGSEGEKLLTSPMMDEPDSPTPPMEETDSVASPNDPPSPTPSTEGNEIRVYTPDVNDPTYQLYIPEWGESPESFTSQTEPHPSQVRVLRLEDSPPPRMFPTYSESPEIQARIDTAVGELDSEAHRLDDLQKTSPIMNYYERELFLQNAKEELVFQLTALHAYLRVQGEFRLTKTESPYYMYRERRRRKRLTTLRSRCSTCLFLHEGLCEQLGTDREEELTVQAQAYYFPMHVPDFNKSGICKQCAPLHSHTFHSLEDHPNLRRFEIKLVDNGCLEKLTTTGPWSALTEHDVVENKPVTTIMTYQRVSTHHLLFMDRPTHHLKGMDFKGMLIQRLAITGIPLWAEIPPIESSIGRKPAEKMEKNPVVLPNISAESCELVGCPQHSGIYRNKEDFPGDPSIPERAREPMRNAAMLVKNVAEDLQQEQQDVPVLGSYETPRWANISPQGVPRVMELLIQRQMHVIHRLCRLPDSLTDSAEVSQADLDLLHYPQVCLSCFNQHPSPCLTKPPRPHPSTTEVKVIFPFSRQLKSGYKYGMATFRLVDEGYLARALMNETAAWDILHNTPTTSNKLDDQWTRIVYTGREYFSRAHFHVIRGKDVESLITHDIKHVAMEGHRNLDYMHDYTMTREKCVAQLRKQMKRILRMHCLERPTNQARMEAAERLDMPNICSNCRSRHTVEMPCIPNVLLSRGNHPVQRRIRVRYPQEVANDCPLQPRTPTHTRGYEPSEGNMLITLCTSYSVIDAGAYETLMEEKDRPAWSRHTYQREGQEWVAHITQIIPHVFEIEVSNQHQGESGRIWEPIRTLRDPTPVENLRDWYPTTAEMLQGLAKEAGIPTPKESEDEAMYSYPLSELKTIIMWNANVGEKRKADTGQGNVLPPKVPKPSKPVLVRCPRISPCSIQTTSVQQQEPEATWTEQHHQKTLEWQPQRGEQQEESVEHFWNPSDQPKHSDQQIVTIQTPVSEIDERRTKMSTPLPLMASEEYKGCEQVHLEQQTTVALIHQPPRIPIACEPDWDFQPTKIQQYIGRKNMDKVIAVWVNQGSVLPTKDCPEGLVGYFDPQILVEDRLPMEKCDLCSDWSHNVYTGTCFIDAFLDHEYKRSTRLYQNYPPQRKLVILKDRFARYYTSQYTLDLPTATTRQPDPDYHEVRHHHWDSRIPMGFQDLLVDAAYKLPFDTTSNIRETLEQWCEAKVRQSEKQ